jgi:hypothetical protein
MKNLLTTLIITFMLLMPIWISKVSRMLLTVGIKRAVIIAMVILSTLFAAAIIVIPIYVRPTSRITQIGGIVAASIYWVLVLGCAYFKWPR